MGAFEYLSVLISIILGLAITQILQGFRDLMQARTRLTLYWPSVLWAILLLAVCVQEWWAMFGWRDHDPWTFVGFSMMLAQTVATYMAAALALPDVKGDEAIDLRTYYYANHRWFFTMGVAAIAISILKDRVLTGAWTSPPLNLAMLLVFLAILLANALFLRERVHKTLAPLAVIWLVLYIALLFPRLH
jgi:hypothetical protein